MLPLIFMKNGKRTSNGTALHVAFVSKFSAIGTWSFHMSGVRLVSLNGSHKPALETNQHFNAVQVLD